MHLVFWWMLTRVFVFSRLCRCVSVVVIPAIAACSDQHVWALGACVLGASRKGPADCGQCFNPGSKQLKLHRSPSVRYDPQACCNLTATSWLALHDHTKHMTSLAMLKTRAAASFHLAGRLHLV